MGSLLAALWGRRERRPSDGRGSKMASSWARQAWLLVPMISSSVVVWVRSEGADWRVWRLQGLSNKAIEAVLRTESTAEHAVRVRR